MHNLCLRWLLCSVFCSSLFRMFTFCQLKLCQARHRSWILITLCEIRPNWFAERLTLAGDRGSRYDWLDLVGVYNNCIIMWKKSVFFFHWWPFDIDTDMQATKISLYNSPSIWLGRLFAHICYTQSTSKDN